MSGFSVVTNFRTTLASSITSTQTNIPVSSVTTTDGHVLTMSDLGNEVYIVVSPGGADMEIIKCTNVSNSPPTFTASVRGMAFYGITETAVPANQKAHNAGSVVIITNAHYVLERFVDKEGNETVGGNKTWTGTQTFQAKVTAPGDNTNRPTLTADNDTVTDTDLITFGQLARTVIAGGNPATDTQLGLVKLSSASSTPLEPVVLNDDEVSATAAPNKVPRADGSGKLSSGWGGAASGLATLDGSDLVVQNPANATTTPTDAKIPIQNLNKVAWNNSAPATGALTSFDGTHWNPLAIGTTGYAVRSNGTNPAYDAIGSNLNAPTRAIGNVYQNGSKFRLAFLSVRLGTTAGNTTNSVAANVENANPPTVVVSQIRNTMAGGDATQVDMLLIIPIPPNYYYQALGSGSQVALQYWYEFDL